MSQERWQKHCSLLELCLPFYMGGSSECGLAPPDYAMLNELARNQVLWGTGVGVLTLHASMREHTSGVLAWFPADQVVFRDTHKYEVTPDVNYYRRAIGLSELAINTVQQQAFVFVHPESAPVVYSEDDFSLSVNPGEILFGVGSGCFTSAGDSVLYRFVTSVTERKSRNCAKRPTQQGGT